MSLEKAIYDFLVQDGNLSTAMEMASLLEQFKNPLVYILLVAMLISFVTGHSTDAWIILFVTLVSTIV